MKKRLFDIVVSILGLILLAPPLVIIALVILLTSEGPIFFRQERVGRFGVLFKIHKFRTMVNDAEEKGMLITVGSDPRVTRIGSFLRRYKLDELPQLIDVLIGHMSLVGPRPEVPMYTKYYPKDKYDLIFSVRPGITDLVSIEFKNENEILANSSCPHQTYVNEVLPIKVKYFEDYVLNRSFFGDVFIILSTIKAVFVRR